MDKKETKLEEITRVIDENKQHTLDIFNKHKGEHVLIDSSVYRFIGIGHDDNDFIYILYNGYKISYCTILSRMIILKNKIDDEDYEDFLRTAKLNHFDSESLYGRDYGEVTGKELRDSVIRSIKYEIENSDVELLDEICLEYN